MYVYKYRLRKGREIGRTEEREGDRGEGDRGAPRKAREIGAHRGKGER